MKRVYVRIIKEYKITFLLAYLLIETIYKTFSHGKRYLLLKTHSWFRIATIDDQKSSTIATINWKTALQRIVAVATKV